MPASKFIKLWAHTRSHTRAEGQRSAVQLVASHLTHQPWPGKRSISWHCLTDRPILQSDHTLIWYQYAGHSDNGDLSWAGEVHANAAGGLDSVAPGPRDQLPLHSLITARPVHQLFPGSFCERMLMTGLQAERVSVSVLTTAASNISGRSQPILSPWYKHYTVSHLAHLVLE